MSISYKFGSESQFRKLPVAGAAMSLRELKLSVVEIHNLAQGPEFDLIVKNVQTGREFKDDNGMIPKGTHVVVQRVDPRVTGRSLLLPRPKEVGTLHFSHEDSSLLESSSTMSAASFAGQSAETADRMGLTEAQRMATFISESNHSWQQAVQQRRFGGGRFRFEAGGGLGGFRGQGFGPGNLYGPPAGQQPQQQFAVINGMPYALLRKTTGSEAAASSEQTVRLPSGEIAIVLKPEESLLQRHLTRGTASSSSSLSSSSGRAADGSSLPPLAPDDVPESLLCSICQGVLEHAVRISCCKARFCDVCIRRFFRLHDRTCPACGRSSQSIAVQADVAARDEIQQMRLQKSNSGDGGGGQSSSPAAAASSAMATADGASSADSYPGREFIRPQSMKDRKAYASPEVVALMHAATRTGPIPPMVGFHYRTNLPASFGLEQGAAERRRRRIAADGQSKEEVETAEQQQDDSTVLVAAREMDPFGESGRGRRGVSQRS